MSEQKTCKNSKIDPDLEKNLRSILEKVFKIKNYCITISYNNFKLFY